MALLQSLEALIEHLKHTNEVDDVDRETIRLASVEIDRLTKQRDAWLSSVSPES